MSSHRDSYRDGYRERDRERTYRDRRQNSRDDRRDREPDDRRDRGPELEHEQSTHRSSSIRTPINTALSLSTPSSVISESNPLPYTKLSDVMRKMLQLQNKRTPVQDRKSALERHLKEKEDMYQKTKSKHTEYPSLSETQENHLRRSRQELKQLEGELGKIDEELSHMCNSFAASLLKSLPEMQKKDDALAFASLEARCNKMETGVQASLKAHKTATEDQFRQKLEEELKAYKAEMNKQSQQKYEDIRKALRSELRAELEAELKDSLKAHQAQLDAQTEQKLDESRKALEAKLRSEFKENLEAYQSELSKQFEDRLQQILQACQAKMDTQCEQRAEKEFQTQAAETLKQIAELGKRMKGVEDANQTMLDDFTPVITRLDSLLSRLRASEESSAKQSDHINSIQLMLRGCEKGVEMMLTNVCNQIGSNFDRVNKKIAALERVSARGSECSQEVNIGVAGEENRQVREGSNPEYQKLFESMDQKYSTLLKQVDDRHEQLEKIVEDKYTRLGRAVEDKYVPLVKTIDDNYANLSNICWGLEEQYQNLNSKDLFQRIIAEASNMLPNSVGNLSTEVNRLNVRLAGIEQQLVNQNQQPDQRVRKRQRVTDE